MLFLIAFIIIMQYRICVLDSVVSDNRDRIQYLEDIITDGVDTDIDVSIELKIKEI